MAKKKFIEDLVCKLDVESGDIVCKVGEKKFEEIRKSVPPKRIIFELEEK